MKNIFARIFRAQIHKKKYVPHVAFFIFAALFVIGNVFSYNPQLVYAATYNFTQTSWAGGITANTAVHPTNETNWSQYTATTTAVAAGSGGVSLTSSNKSIVDGGQGLTYVTNIAAGVSPQKITVSPDGTSAYVANSGTNNVSQYSRNTSTGALTALGTPTIAAGTNPYSITISADGTSVYTANSGDATISMYSRNTSTGALTALGTPTISTGTLPRDITISPDGTSVYVTNYTSGNVSMYSRNTSTGALTALATPTIATGTNPYGITISPDGTSVYTANFTGTTISEYSRNTSTGALTALATPTIATGSLPMGITISADGTSVYATNRGGNTVSMYSRNTSTGALTALATPTIATGAYPWGIIISPDGTSVFVANDNSVNISQYSRNTSTGALTALGTPTITTGDGGNASAGITISPDGTSVYVGASTISEYRRTTTGPGFESGTFSSTAISGSGSAASVGIFSASQGLLSAIGVQSPIAAGASPYDTVISADGTSVYVVNSGSGTISMYSRNTSTGALTALATPTIAAGTGSEGITISPDGTSVYAANWTDGTISMYSRNTSTGALTALGTPTIAAGSGTYAAAISPDGTSVYVTNYTSGNVSMYSRNTSTGALTNFSSIAAGSDPDGIRVSPDGTSVYVANYNGGTVSMYSRNTSTGALTALGTPTITTGGSPIGFAISPDGTSVYVTNYVGNTVLEYSRNTSTGALTALATPTIAAGTGPEAVTISADGTSVYAVNRISANVSIYSRNTSTGVLTIPGTTAAGTSPEGVTISPDGTSVYVTNYGGTVSEYSRNTSTGALTALGTPTIAAGTNPIGVTISADGTSVYVANWTDGTISMYSRNTSTGALTALGTPTIATGSDPYNIIISADGTSVYAANYGTSNVSMYSRNTSTGALTAFATPTIAAGTNPYSITISADGTSVYAANYTSSTISMYSRNIGLYSGTFTSGVITTGVPSAFTTLSYGTTLNGQTLTMDVRAGNTATPDGTWTAWQTNIASGGSISGFTGNQYIQYRANLSTTVTTATPTLNNVTINYSQYASSGSLTSSTYDTGQATNLTARITWVDTATTTANTVKFQVRSSPDGTTWSAWCGYADCSGTSYFTDSSGNGQDMATNHPLRSGGDDRYLQYKAFLTSGGSGTPSLTSVSLKYVINAPPDFDTTYGTNGVTVSQDATSADAAWGKVNISYKVRDIDTSTGTINPGFVTPSFEYSINGGTSWTAIPTGDLKAADITNKAVDQVIYNAYSATWTASSTLPSTFNTNMKIRVTANDNEAANNTAQAVSAAFTLDTKAPVAAVTTVATSTPERISVSVTDDSQIQYRICNDTTFPTTDAQGNSCAWSTLATSPVAATSNWVFSSTVNDAPVYVQVQDAYGNTSTQTVTIPMTPLNLSFVDVSSIVSTTDLTKNSYGEFLIWAAFKPSNHPGYTFRSYDVYKSTNGGSTYTLLNSSTNDPTINYYVDSIIGVPNQTVPLYYKVVITTTAGNTSPYSTIVQTIPNGHGQGGALTPTVPAPVVSILDDGTATSTVSATSEKITFTTNSPATATITYDPTSLGENCSTYQNTTTTTSYATTQSITLTGLTQNTPYSFCVQSTSTGYNSSVATSTTNGGAPLSFTTPPANTISSVTTSNVNNSAFTVSWNTASSSSSYVTYAPATSLVNGVLVNATSTGSAYLVSSHQVNVSGLTAGTPYAFSLKSTDGLGNAVTSNNNGTFYFATTTIDAAPVISFAGVTATSSILATSELIKFNTDKIATSTVSYGTTPALGLGTTTTTTFGTAQTIKLTGLTSNTLYYFSVQAQDVAGTVSTATTTTDTGLPLQFTTIAANGITGAVKTPNLNSFSVSWNTASSSDSYVTYATNAQLTNATTTGSTAFTLAHTVNVTGLAQNTLYYFSLKSTDSAGNVATTTVDTITTTNDAAPVISGIATSTVLANSATIAFTTDKLATSTIQYGTGGSCGSYTSGGTQSTTAFATAQILTLTGLNSNTLYSFCVKSQDVAGTVSAATSTTGTGMALAFTTATGPVISNLQGNSVDASTYSITWNTATSSDAYVYYSTATSSDSTLTNPQSAASSTPALTHQVTLTGLAVGVPYYYYIKSTDGSGNFSTNTNNGVYWSIPAKRDTTPPVISNITTSVPVSADQAAIVWQTNKSTTSQVYYGTSSGTYPNFTSVNSALSIYHVVTLASTTPNGAGGTTSLSPRGIYHFVVASVDASGNSATSTDQILDTNNIDNVLPAVSAITVTPKSTSAVVTFTTSKVATSTAEYSLDGTSWTSVSDTVFGVSHSLTFSGLIPNTTYLYQIQASDAIGNISTWVSGSSSTFTTTGGPILTSIAVPDITRLSSSAIITWNTSTSSDSEVYYSPDSSFVRPLSVITPALVTAHSIKISSLSSTTKYYFYVQSINSDGNSTIDNNNGTYYNFTTSADLTPPVISAISVPVTSPSSAVITWQTDKLSTSQVEYGMVASTTDGTYPTVTDINSTPSIFHIVTLSPLVGGDIVAGNNTYYYRVKSVDTSPAANVAVSPEQTFTSSPQGQTQIVTVTQFISQSSGTGSSAVTTTPPQITSVTPGTIDAFDAQINVVTDKDTTTFLSYGTTTAYGSIEGDKNLSSSKAITLSQLTEGTTYHYQVQVTDQYGNIATGADQTFTTKFASEDLTNLSSLQNAADLQGKIEQLIQSSLPSLAPPFITKPTVSSTTENSATITWTTNIKAIGSLKYATDANYTSTNGYTAEASEGQVTTTDHSVTLTSLEPNTLYHVQARSYVFPQVVGSSPDLTFSTQAAPITVNIVSVKNSGFTVAWQTNDLTSSIVEYRNIKTGESNLVTDNTMKTYHDVQVQNLPAGVSYLVSVSGLNANGNRIDSGAPITITTSVDVTPPVISNFKVDNAIVPGPVGFIQTVVSWQTDKPSNSAVYYQEGASPATGGAELANKVEALDTYTTAHIMIVANLKAGTVYSIKITSVDQSGNTKSFGPTSIITPQQTQSVLDIIIKNFEDTFQFLGAKQ